MSSKEVGIEEARKRLGDLVTAVQHGTDVVLTRNGKPAARIVPVENIMTWSLKVPGKSNLALTGTSLTGAVEGNFPSIAKELRVYRRGGYVLQSVTLKRGDGKIGGQTYAELTITALPSQALPKPGVTDQAETYTGWIFAKTEDIPAEPHEFTIESLAS